MNPEDKVFYIPHAAHALQKNLRGEYSWIMGWKTKVIKKGQLVDEVEELEGAKLDEYIAQIRRHPQPEVEKKNLVFLRPNPNALWPATVASVNPDGTVNLDILAHATLVGGQYIGNGVTLHYRNVPADHAKKSPHTCHALPENTPDHHLSSWLAIDKAAHTAPKTETLTASEGE